MVKLAKFINDQSDGNVAGSLYVNRDKTEFRYYRSTSDALPAFVNALQATGKGKKIYTSYKTAPWPKSIVDTVKGKASLNFNTGDGAIEVTPVECTDRAWPAQIISTGTGSAPVEGGGLHAAAQGIMGSPGLAADGSKARGLQRALRYYMLATYSLVDLSAEEAYCGLNNYVGTLLVGDDGRILAGGINTGSYRHAEVSMLVSYFRNNPTAKTLPAKSVVFSTLTPCKQCTAYLTSVKAHDTVIYFGQEDTGKDGRVGKSISAQLSSKTKQLQGHTKDPQVATSSSDAGGGSVAIGTASGIHKVRIDQRLTDCMGTGMIAKQIGRAGKSRAILSSSSNALIHKVLKGRDDGNPEEAVKQAVLQYITGWIGRVKLTS